MVLSLSGAVSLSDEHVTIPAAFILTNLVPRVLRLFGQKLVASRDSKDIKKKLLLFFDWLFRNGFHCFTAEILR